MKKFIFLPLVSLLAMFLLNSCLKDKLTKTYTIYTPVYKTKAQVLANVKTNGAETIKKAGKLFLYGKYILVNEIDKGIHIIDNANPVKPKNLGFIDIPGNVDLAVRDNVLYADLYSDLVTIDITNPLQATLKKVVKNAFPHRRYAGNSGFVADTNRIIVDWIKKDTVVDLKNQESPLWNCRNCGIALQSFSSDASGLRKSSPSAIAGSMARFAVVNGNLYTVDNNNLNVFSIATPDEPVFTKKVSVGWGIETLFPFKDKLFIGSNFGMFIFDISNGSTPQKMGQFNHARVCDPVIAEDDFAFVTLRTGACAIGGNALNQLDVVNITNLNAPFLLRSYRLTNPHGLSKDGNLLFICDGSDGLKVFDAKDVNNLKQVKHFPGFDSYDVIAHNKVAIVVEKSGIRQFDYTNPADIKYLSTISW